MRWQFIEKLTVGFHFQRKNDELKNKLELYESAGILGNL